jgi:hypothetical protein
MVGVYFLCLKDKGGKGALMRNTTTLTCPTTIQGVVGISCDSLLFTFFGFILFVITIWHHERTSRQKDGQANDVVALK